MGDTISDARKLTAPRFVNSNILFQVAPFQHLYFAPGHSRHLRLPPPPLSPRPNMPHHNLFSSIYNIRI